MTTNQMMPPVPDEAKAYGKAPRKFVERDPTGERYAAAQESPFAVGIFAKSKVFGAAPTSSSISAPEPLSDGQLELSLAASATLGLNRGDSEAVARTLDRMTQDHPWLTQELSDNFLQVVQLSEAERIFNTLNEQPGVEASLSEEMYRAAYDMLVDNRWRYTTWQQSIAQGEQAQTLSTLKVRNVDFRSDVAGTGEYLGIVGGGEADKTNDVITGADLVNLGLSADAATLVGRLGGAERSVDTIWLPEQRRVVLVVNYKTGERQTILDAVLDEGVNPTNAHDAFVEGLLAWDGKAHTVALRDDAHGRQTLIGLLSEPIGGLTNLVSEIPGTRFLTSGLQDVTLDSDRDARRDSQIAEIDRRVQSFTDDLDYYDAAVAYTAAITPMAGSPLLAAREATGFVDEMPDDMWYAFAGGEADNYRERLMAARDDRNAIKRGFGEALEQGATLMEGYDWLLHHIVLAPSALIEGGLSAVGVPGLRDLEESWDAAWEAERVSDWANVDDQAYEAWLDFGVSVVADPFFWITPNGHGMAQQLDRWLTTRAGSAELAQGPMMRRQVVKVLDSVESGDLFPAFVATHGSDPAHQLLLMDPEALAAVAAREGMTVEAVVTAELRDSLPAFGGTHIPNPGAHIVERNGTTILAEVGRASESSTRFASFMRRAVASFDKDRTLRLGGGAADDLRRWVEQAFSSPEHREVANEAIRDTLEVLTDYSHGAGLTNTRTLKAHLTELHARRDALRDALPSEARKVPRAEAARLDAERQLSEIDSQIAALGDLPDDMPNPAIDGALQELRLGLDDLRSGDDTGASEAAIARLREIVAQDEAGLGTNQVNDLLSRLEQSMKTLPSDALAREDLIDNLLIARDELDEALYVANQGTDAARRVPLEADAARRTALEADYALIEAGLPQTDDVMRLAYDDFAVGEATLTDEIQRTLRLIAASELPGNSDMLVALAERNLSRSGEILRKKGFLQFKEGEFYPNNPGLPMHDWKTISGRDWAPGDFRELGVSLPRSTGALLYGIDPTDDKAVLARLKDWVNPRTKANEAHLSALQATGHYASQTVMQMPVSPAEIALFEDTLQRLGVEKGLARWTSMMEKARDKGSGRWMRLYSTNLLLHPILALKTNMDEVIGLAAREGRWLRREKITRLGGEFGDEVVQGTAPGPIEGGLRTFGGDKSFIDQESLGYARTTQPTWNRRAAEDSYRTYQPGESGFKDAARWELNGVFGDDPIIQRVAAAELANDPNLFLDWWQAEGRIRARAPHFTENGRRIPVTGQVAYDARVQAIDLIASHVDESHRAAFREALLKRAAGGPDIPDALLAHYNWTATGPIRSPEKRKGLARLRPSIDAGFDMMHGGPGSRRGAFIHQHYQSQALGWLMKAKKANGTLADTAYFAQLWKTDRADAFARVAAMTEAQRAAIRRQGMWFPDELNDIAWNYGKRQADQWMYQPGASSFLGRKYGQKVSVFGPSQIDFSTRLGQTMSDAAIVGWRFGSKGKALKLPFSKGKPLPLNLRLMGRAAALSAAASTQIREQQREGEEPGFRGPLAAIERATYYPLGFDSNMVGRILPGLTHPIPLWAVQFLPLDAGEEASTATRFGAFTRELAETLSPGLTYNREHYGDQGLLGFATALESSMGLFNAWLPAGTTTMRGMTESGLVNLLRLASTESPVDMAAFVAESNDIISFRRPAGWNWILKNSIGDQLAQLGPGQIPIQGSDEMRTFQNGAFEAAYDNAANDQLLATGARLSFGIMEGPNFDGEQIEHWSGLVESVGELHRLGYIGDSQVENLSELWAMFQPATRPEHLSPEAAYRLSDVANDIWYELPRTVQDALIVNHPELAVNTVGSYQAVLDGAGNPLNAEYGGRGGRLNLPAGDEGREVLRRGLEEGWVTYRTNEDIWSSTMARYSAALSRTASNLWLTRTGVAWRNPINAAGEVVMAESRQRNRVNLSDAEVRQWAGVGIQVSSGMTMLELATTIQAAKDGWIGYADPTGEGPRVDALLRDVAARTTDGAAVAHFADKLKEQWQLANAAHDDQAIEGPVSFSEWEPEWQRYALDGFNALIDAGFMTQSDYNTIAAPLYGDNSYEAPIPPTWSDLPTEAAKMEPRSVVVIDGDTLQVDTGTETVLVRLLGVNAADFNTAHPQSQAEAVKQANNLEMAIRNATTVQFANYDPRRFGGVQSYLDGGERLFFFLYLDGRPVFDSGLFSPENPTGRGMTGDGIPAEWYEGLTQ